jgi:ubiquinone/menaquinone biosynthesis C-methylase UbiE
MIEGHYAFAPEIAEAGAGYEADFFGQLVSLEAQHFWFRSRNRLITWALKHYFPDAKSFLEIGCGTGFVLSGIEATCPNLTVYGSEAFSKGLSFASQRLNKAELFQMDARRIPFLEEFDVIGCFDVLEHIQEDVDVLAEIYRSVVPGGGVLLTVPQHPWLWSYQDDYSHHLRRYCTAPLRVAMERIGFEIIRMTSFVSLLLPLMVLSRWSRRKAKPDSDVMAEFKISPRINAILENVLNLERRLIQKNISFPAGGSLLVVARKP